MSSKKLLYSLDIQFFYHFFTYYPNFPDSKGQTVPILEFKGSVRDVQKGHPTTVTQVNLIL